jgi:hypothetical protein
MRVNEGKRAESSKSRGSKAVRLDTCKVFATLG